MTDAEIRALEERLAREVLDSSMVVKSAQVFVDKHRTWSPWTSVEDAVECLEATGEDWELRHVAAMAHGTSSDWVARVVGAFARPGSAPTLPQAICKALEAWLDAK